MRTGRRVAFDVGQARIGVAVSDPHGILASPRPFVTRKPAIADTILEMLSAIGEDDPIEFYIGLPLNLKSAATLSTEDSLMVARELQANCSVSVRLVDERMTTRIASGSLSNAGKTSKQQRGAIDSASAAVILETALHFEKANNIPPGIAIGDYESGN